MALKTFATFAAYQLAKPKLLATDTVSIVATTLLPGDIAKLGVDPKVVSIRVPTARLSVAAYNAASAKLNALDKITIADKAATIQTNLATLLSDTKVDFIDSTENIAIKLTAAQAIVAANVAKLLAADAITVSDTSANINTNLVKLLAETKVDFINSTQDNTAIKLTAAQSLSAANMAKLQSTDFISVVDTSANIQANLPALFNNAKVDFINSSEDTVAIKLTVAQAGNAAYMAKITNLDTYTVSDTTANIQANLTALFANPNVKNIDPTEAAAKLTLTAAQALVANNMAKLSSTDVVTVVLSADDVLTPTQLAALHADAKIDAVTDVYAMAASTDLVLEGASVIFTVTRIDSTSAKSLSYSVKGDTSGGSVDAATAGTDFTPTTGTVTFAAGEKTATITVNATSDSATESFEGLSVSLFSGITKLLQSDAVFISDDPNAPVAGKTLTLTTGADNLAGDTGDDIFDAGLAGSAGTTMTFGSADTLSGGSGDDTLNLTINGQSTYRAAAMTGIEELVVTFTDTGTFNLLGSTGVTSIETNSSTANSKFTNIASTSVALNATAVGDSNMEFAYTTTAVAAATGDEATLTLNGVGQLVNKTTTVSGIETLNIVSTSSANSLGDIVDTSLTQIVVSGDQDLSIKNALDANVTKVDAGTFTGALTITTGNVAQTVIGGAGNDNIDVSNAVNKTVSVDGGLGDDSITLGAATDLTDVVKGGQGNDTLVVSEQVAVADGVGITGFESVSFVDATEDASVAQDMDAFAGVTSINIGDINDRGAVITDAAAGQSLSITAADGVGHSFALKTDTTNDTVAVVMGTSTVAAGTIDALTMNEAETITINSIGGNNEITTLTANDLTSLTITGDKKLVIADIVAGTTAITTVNASATTGSVDVDIASNANAATMTGGTGADSLKGGDGNDSINGGDGDDTLDGDIGNNTIDGGAGADQITAAGGNDVLNGGDGKDSITGGAGNDNISAGAGDDTITMVSGDLTSADTVDGGDGNDTLAITTAVGISTAPTLTSIEKISIVTSHATAVDTINLSSAASLKEVEIAATGTTDSSFAITGLVSGVTAKLLEDGTSAVTLDTAVGAALTVDVAINTDTTLTVSDATSVTITDTGSTNSGDLTDLILDDVDTTSLTFKGSSVASEVLSTDDITMTNALASLNVTTSTAGANVTFNDLADADALTSLSVIASYGDVTFGGVIGTAGAAGNAESLSTITLTATNGGDITLKEIIADDVDSATDNTMTITASADSLSSVDLGIITNTTGVVTLNASGAGNVNALNGSAVISGDDVNVNVTGKGGTYDKVLAADDITITAANTGALTFSVLDSGATSTGAINVTATGSGALEISDVVTSLGTLTVNGTSATGTIKVASTDDFGGIVSITGGAGNDSLMGGAGNDILIGGAGEDELTATSGTDSLSGGEGNDKLVLGTGWGSTDTTDGGNGTDTVTMTVNATVVPSFTGIEKAEITFDTGGAINASNIGASTITVLGLGGATTATVVNLATNTTVVNTGALEIETLSLDTLVLGATLNVSMLETATNALTITDAGTVNIDSTDTAAATGFGNVVLDTVDTTKLNVTGANTAYATTLGAVTGTNALTTITASTSIDVADVTIGQVADLGAMTAVTLTAVGGDLTLSTGANFGTAASDGDEGETLANITLNASSGALIDFADGQSIFLDTTTDSTTDLVNAVSATTAVSSTINVGSIDNEFGSINVTATNAGTLTFDGLFATDVTVTASGSGVLDIANIDSINDVTINASNTAGTVTIVLDDVTAQAAITTGSGAATITTGDTTGALDGSTTITLGLTNGALDTIKLNPTATAPVTITNFENGTGLDLVQISNAGAGKTIESLGDADTASGNVTGLTLATCSAALNLNTLATTDELLVVSGDFLTEALLAAAFETGGTRALTFNASATSFATTEAIPVLWDDGSNSYLSLLTSDNAVTDGNLILAGQANITTLVTFVGISDSSTFVGADFDLVA